MKLEKSEVIWFNGEFVAWDDAQVHVLSHALHYASSAFEGLRAYATPRGAAILQLDPHVERLYRTCKIIHLPLEFSRDQVRDAIVETVARNGHDSCYIRPLVFRGYSELGIDPRGCPMNLIIATWPHGSHFGDEAREQGLDLGVSSWRRMAPDTHPAMAKAVGNYLNSQMIMLEAKQHGYADGIALDADGYACETSGGNLFIVLDGTVFTPPLDGAVLPGITRACAITLLREMGLELCERRVAREMLYMAEEVFVTGTAAEITPVRSIDQKPVGSGHRGPVTERVQQEFFRLVRGEVEDRHGWLKFVGEPQRAES
jgi:branched-chain amino acid aminotransferase